MTHISLLLTPDIRHCNYVMVYLGKGKGQITGELTLPLVIILATIALSPFIPKYSKIPVIVIEIIIGIIIGKSLFNFHLILCLISFLLSVSSVLCF